jgi:hypothetical protein
MASGQPNPIFWLVSRDENLDELNQQEQNMRKGIQGEVKLVLPLPRQQRPERQRDPSMTGGERMETVAEKRRREQQAQAFKEAPIIQKDVT